MPFTSYEILKRLVAFDTTSRLSNMDLIQFCTDHLEPLGFRCTVIPNEEQTKANLFATIGPDTDGGIVFSGHTDTVPVDGQDWDTDPFTLTQRGERLFGRGTADMKTFLACALALAPQIAATRLSQPIHFAFSYDEEVGCAGVGSMIDHIVRAGIRPMLVIVGEPTSMNVVDAHKAISSYRTTVIGHEAHSSRTHEGVNAVSIAARLISHLDAIAEEMRELGDPSGRFDPPYTSLSVGLIEGGTAVNIIPRSCTFAWEYRSLPDQDIAEIIGRFTDYCAREVLPPLRARSPDVKIETKRRSGAPALAMPKGNPAEALILHLAGRNKTESAAYATEGGLFQAADIPTYVCGPGDIAQAHKPNEFIERHQIEACEALMRRVVESLKA